jgi:F-type H+-transporting ATPase subunit gamma
LATHSRFGVGNLVVNPTAALVGTEYNFCCVQAMESSTKNSKEMLEKLTLSYNRTRQAKITTELNEIISGALSLEESSVQ